MRLLTVGCAALGFAASALGVEIEYAGSDPAVKFAVKDAKECLKGAKGRLVLKDDPSLAFQEWRLKTADDGALVVSGRDGMGIVYGLYTFLEKYAGCRWYSLDTTVIPDRTGWEVPAVDDRGIPAILDREMYVGSDYMNGTWRLRNKETQRVAYGCGVFVGAPGGCHTFAAYSKAVAAAGKKVDGGEFCLTDPEVRHIVAEQMKAYIRKDRDARRGRPAYDLPTIYELSQNDGGRGFQCKCESCRALFRAAGSWSGPNIAFASAVAEEVGREFPDVKVRTFAYSFTERPPTNVLVAADNLMIRYCRSFLFQPLTAETDNGRIVRGWDEHVKDKQVWGYWRSYSGPLFPAVKPREDIGKEMRFCRDMHVCGYFAEAESPMSRSFSAMQHWLFLKLAENPDRDVFALADEFVRAYYGPAAEPMLAYLDYLERRQKDCYAKLDPKFVYGLGSGDLAMYVQRGYLDRDFFEKANGWLEKAERLAAGDERAARHVAQERLVVDRSMLDILQQLAAEGYSPDMRQVAARMRTTLPSLIRAWTSIPAKEAAPRLEKAAFEATIAAQLPAPVPAELKGRKYVEWQCDKLGGDSKSEVVKDADSVTGYARTFPNAAHKLPYMAGLYDDQVRKDIGIRLEAKDIPQDGKFHLVRLGTFDIVCQSRVYFDWTWRYATWVPSFGVQTDRREVWLSVKLTGPTYVKGAAAPDAIALERLFLVEP